MLAQISFLGALLDGVLSWQCDVGSEQYTGVQNNCRTKLWDVGPIDYTENNTAGFDYLNNVTAVEFYNGVEVGRTYAHSPLLLFADNTVILVHSSALQDEDSQGQDVWGGVSHDDGYTWTDPVEIFPPALLPNQTNQANFTYWAENRIPQRAWGALDAVKSPLTGTVYAIADCAIFFCDDGVVGHAYVRSGGRAARPMDIVTGQPSGDPCWLFQTEYTDRVNFADTVYGTQYGMKYCDEKDTLIQVLSYPADTPNASPVLYANKYYASDGVHDVQEPTNGVWDVDDHYFQRFWRDISSSTVNSHRIWTACTCNNSGWYPNDVPLDGSVLTNDSHPIFETDIVDANSKQWFGYVSTSTHGKIRYLVSNPRNNTAGDRFPLTLAWQGLNDAESDWTFKSIGIIATNPSNSSVSDSRYYKNKGFQYPSAVQVGNNLVVAYSENKQNIWVSIVPLAALG